MKNSKEQTLPQPYLDLAMMRREQQNREGDDINDLSCFDWSITKEKSKWWHDVYIGHSPEIPAASLAELEEWRKAKAEPTDTADWKAMYNEICERYKELEKEANELTATLKELGVKYDELKTDYNILNSQYQIVTMPTSELKCLNRNWVAECAMAAMQGLLSDPNYKDVQHTIAGNIVTKPRPDVIAERAFEYAEAMLAEGKKRGHIN